MDFEASLLECISEKGLTVPGYSIDPRHAGPRACAIGGFRRRFDAGPVPWPNTTISCRRRLRRSCRRSCCRCSNKRTCRNIHRSLCASSRKNRNLKSGSRTPPAISRSSRSIRSVGGQAILGRRSHAGDRQAPEGFYTITPELMNPNSNYYLAINTGFPNAFDKANDRDGTFLMIHGDCASSGCYAMTDEQIGEIYSLARDSLLGSQQSFQIQAYPFRMTPANLARHRTNPHMAFWKMLKVGNDHFEATHLEPKVEVCNRRYVFDAQQPPNSSKPARVRSDRQMPRLCRQPGNRTAGAGETTRRRGPIRAIGQSQRASRSNPQRARRGNEPSFPRPGWGQHTPGSSFRRRDLDRRKRPITMVRWRVNCSACSDGSRPHRRKSPRPIRRRRNAERNSATTGSTATPKAKLASQIETFAAANVEAQ